jgi:nucleoside-diphosphate-sugar epimerase
VTGALGCLGAWVLRFLVRQGETAVSFDLSETRHRLDLLLSREEQQAITFVRGDLTDTQQVQAVVDQYQVTHIIHLAALQVPFCKAQPVVGAQVNVVGTVNVFEAARKAGLRQVVYASSVAAYGPPSDYPPGPLAPDAPFYPRTLYGVYKAADEGIARIYWQDHGIASVTLRPYAIYGLGRDQGVSSDPTKAMQAAAAGQPYHINFGGMLQLNYAADVAQHFIQAAETRVKGALGFNFGDPPVSVDQLIEIIQQVKPGVQITHAASGLPFPYEYDGTPLERFSPKRYFTRLEEGVRETIRNFENQNQ